MKFSVVIPVYNVAPYLRECLDSVLAQTYPHWEAICVDDGSSDGGGAILDEYANVEPRIHVIHKANGGVASARNAAFAVLSGEWFLCLDADDVWAPTLLADCLKVIERVPEADVISFFCRGFRQTEGCLWPESSDEQELEIRDLSGDFDHTRFGTLAQCKAYPRNLMGDLRQGNYVVGEDLLFLVQCYLRVRKEIVIGKRLYGYRVRGQSAIHGSTTFRSVKDSVLSVLDVYAELQKSGRSVAPVTRKWLGNAIFENCVWKAHSLSRIERLQFLSFWRSQLVRIWPGTLLGGFDRFRMCIGRWFPRLGSLVLGVWLECLKRHGIHR